MKSEEGEVAGVAGTTSEVKQFVTLEQLCSEDAQRDQAEKYLERYGGWIRYRTRVPLDMLLRAQKRFMSGKKKDNEGFFVFLLRYLLLSPRVDTDEQARALLKADGRVMVEIIGQAVGNVSDMQEEAADEAGEL